MRLTLLASILVASIPAFGITFTDSNLTLANYALSQFSSAGVTQTFQNTAIGNPSNGFLNTAVVPAGGSTSAYAMIGNAFTYNPGVSGTINNISASLDVRDDLATGQIFVLGWDLWIKQGSTFYFHDIVGPQTTQGVFFTFSESGITSGSFSAFDFSTGSTNSSLHPNFSQPLAFGPGVVFDWTAVPVGGNTGNFYTDNLSIVVNPVPEPSTMMVGPFLLAGVLLRNRYRR